MSTEQKELKSVEGKALPASRQKVSPPWLLTNRRATADEDELAVLVCGRKNSGKTTLIQSLQRLSGRDATVVQDTEGVALLDIVPVYLRAAASDTLGLAPQQTGLELSGASDDQTMSGIVLPSWEHAEEVPCVKEIVKEEWLRCRALAGVIVISAADPLTAYNDAKSWLAFTLSFLPSVASLADDLTTLFAAQQQARKADSEAAKQSRAKSASIEKKNEGGSADSEPFPVSRAGIPLIVVYQASLMVINARDPAHLNFPKLSTWLRESKGRTTGLQSQMSPTFFIMSETKEDIERYAQEKGVNLASDIHLHIAPQFSQAQNSRGFSKRPQKQFATMEFSRFLSRMAAKS